MNVRLVWTSKRRVPKNGILSFSTCAISITSPVLISCVARSTAAGFMWLAEPRSSPAPHFEGQRWLSGGTVQVCASAGAYVRAVAAARTSPTTVCRMVALQSPGGATGPLGDGKRAPSLYRFGA